MRDSLPRQIVYYADEYTSSEGSDYDYSSEREDLNEILIVE